MLYRQGFPVVQLHGAAKNVPKQKLQFLRICSIFYYKIVYDYSQGLIELLLLITFIKLC